MRIGNTTLIKGGPVGGAARAFDADVLSWEAAVIANGGSVSLARRIIVDQFVFAEKASGAWALTDDYWGLWGENAAQALTSLKQRRLAVATNTPTFTPNRGYESDTIASYIATGFNFATHAVAATVGNSRIGVYARGNVNSASTAMGASYNSSRGTRLRPRSTGVIVTQINTTVDTLVNSVANSQGLTAVSRNGSSGAVGKAYKNGVLFETYTPAGFSSGLSTLEVFLLCYNANGTPTGLYPSEVGFAVVGASLSDAQELAQYNAVQAWATSIGANV